MKKGMLIVFVSLFLILFTVHVFAAERNENAQPQNVQSDTIISQSGIYESAERLDNETKQFLEQIGLSEMDAQSAFELNYQTVLKAFVSAFSLSFSEVFKKMALVIGAVLIGALADAAGEGLLKAKNDKIYHMCTMLTVTCVCVAPLCEVMQQSESAVQTASTFSIGAIPAMCVILAAQGKGVTAGVFNGSAVALSQVLSLLFTQFFVPAAKMMLGIGIAGGFFEKMHIHHLLRLVRKYLLIGLSISATVYFSVLSMRSGLSAAADETAIKAVKLASGNFVPVIGSAISESAGTVVSALTVSKNAVGIFGVAAIAGVFLPVLVKLMMWMLCLEIGALIAQSFQSDVSASMLKTMANTVSLLLIITVFGAVVLLMNISLLIHVRGVS